MHREIEVKYRVRDSDELQLALLARGVKLSSVMYQDDHAYAESGWQYGMSKVGRSFARLRTQDGRHTFTLKRPTANEQACVEFETDVADRNEMHGALTNMGFYPTVRIVKTRRIGRLTRPGHTGRIGRLRPLARPRSGRITETHDSLARLAPASV